MLEKDEGIVLAAGRSGETSLLVTFLGRRTGKIRLMAKGALGLRHPARGLLEPGNHLEVLFYNREGRTLLFLKEAALLTAACAPRDSLPHMAVLLAVLELLDHVCYSGGADIEIVDLGVEYIRTGASTDPLLVFLAFELRLLGALGAVPDLSACATCGRALERGVYSARAGEAHCREHGTAIPDTIALGPDVIAAAAQARSDPLETIAAMEIDRRTRKTLGKILHWTYTFHVQGYSLPKSLNLI